MYKKILRTMIALVIIFLLSLYILKIFFPEQFTIVVQNENIIQIGKYIDNNLWAYYISGIITSFITYWLYLCASCNKWYLNWKEIILVIIAIALTMISSSIDNNLYIAITYISFILLPFIFKADFKSTTIMFSIHLLSQFLTLSIRDLTAYIVDSNSLVILVSTFDCYLWLLLGYLYFNLIKKENK